MNLFGESPLLSLPSFSIDPQSITRGKISESAADYKSAPEEILYFPANKSAYQGGRDDSLSSSHAKGEEEIQAALSRLAGIHRQMTSPQVVDILLSVDRQLYSSPAIMTALLKQLGSFSMMKYAEEHFLWERKQGHDALEKLLSYRSEPWMSPCLHTALWKSASKTVLEELQACLKLAMGFMGDTQTNSSSSDLLNQFLHRTFAASKLFSPSSQKTDKSGSVNIFTDEIFCQLCSLVSSNPSKRSAEMGWQLMLICLAMFPPSSRLLPALLHSFLVASAADLMGSSFPSRALSAAMMAAQSQARRAVPSPSEVQALLLGESCGVSVRTLDGRSSLFQTDSYTTVRQLELLLWEALGIVLPAQTKQRISEMFALYEVQDDVDLTEGLLLLDPEDRVLDVATRLAENHDGKKKTLLFKVRYHFPLDDLQDMQIEESSLRAISHLLYWQAVQDVTRGVYPCHLEDAILLAAIRLAADSPHHSPFSSSHHKNVPSNYYPNTIDVERLICKEFFLPKDVDTEKRMQTCAQKIAALAKKFTAAESVDYRSLYLKYVSSWRLFGGTFFSVSSLSGSPAAGLSVVLSVSAKGLVIVDATEMTYVAEFAHDQLLAWSHSFDSFIFTAVSAANSAKGGERLKVKMRFRTLQGEEINNLLNIYNNFRLSKSVSN